MKVKGEGNQTEGRGESFLIWRRVRVEEEGNLTRNTVHWGAGR